MSDKNQTKREKMKHPDWEKYSGFPPAEPASEDTKRKSKVKSVELDEDGDSN